MILKLLSTIHLCGLLILFPINYYKAEHESLLSDLIDWPSLFSAVLIVPILLSIQFLFLKNLTSTKKVLFAMQGMAGIVSSVALFYLMRIGTLKAAEVNIVATILPFLNAAISLLAILLCVMSSTYTQRLLMK